MSIFTEGLAGSDLMIDMMDEVITEHETHVLDHKAHSTSFLALIIE
jgi:hypothetical protein